MTTWRTTNVPRRSADARPGTASTGRRYAIATSTAASRIVAIPHPAVTIRQARRNRGSRSHTTSQSAVGIVVRSIRSRAIEKPNGRRRHSEPSSTTPIAAVKTALLASRKRGLPDTYEIATLATSTVRTKRPSTSIRRGRIHCAIAKAPVSTDGTTRATQTLAPAARSAW